MNLNDHILLWNHVFMKILDVRKNALEPGEKLSHYQLPASAYLYMIDGTARVRMDQHCYIIDGFHVVHGGKLADLEIETDSGVAYYMILYKAILPLPCRMEIQQLMEYERPFQNQFGMIPANPLDMYQCIEALYWEWEQPTKLAKLHAKVLFQQWVYSLLEDLHNQSIQPFKPDLVTRAVEYMNTHMQEPLGLDKMGEELDCSVGHLSRLFKQKLNVSPIQYLAQRRVERAAYLMTHTDATLQLIAEQVGYPDAHSLSRSFKKIEGLSPVQYKKKQRMNGAKQEIPFQKKHDLPHLMQENALQPLYSHLYNDIDYQYQKNVGGELFMQGKFKMTALSMLLCFTLLLAACSSPAPSASNAQPETATPTAQSSNQTTTDGKSATSVETRTVSTLRGDVVIPANPQRVASDQYMGYLLKLGIIPVGVRTFMLNESWIEKSGISEDIIAGIEDLGGEFPMNLEKLVSLEPDLIIGSIDKNIEDYEKIATTVFLPYWEGETTSGPLEKLRRIASVFGKEKEAEQWITTYQAEVEEAKKQIDGIIKEGETVSIVQVGNKALYVMAAEGGNYGSSTIYDMLKLPPTQQALDMKEGFENISLEVLPEYMGDHVFIYGSQDEGANEVLNSEVWKHLPAVQKGQVYAYGSFGDKGDEFVMEDPFSLELQLDTIKNLLLNAKK
ncbi:iron complex transport system substrate-binding protein [Paenibacillus amylolyticus]|uniref:Iron complex transport system substrate-binding protein n=1 Tax=Paenibacillus amylolyticus TaxID=1451 RepID=A0AAP5H277_PAEAM|nr:AraC family transcriptional regulator [Paenibacillus amylolyticus]MDR6722581.1 iron complex transport system substrate-binding protein [Paenibacillus amylolyticus]